MFLCSCMALVNVFVVLRTNKSLPVKKASLSCSFTSTCKHARPRNYLCIKEHLKRPLTKISYRQVMTTSFCTAIANRACCLFFGMAISDGLIMTTASMIPDTTGLISRRRAGVSVTGELHAIQLYCLGRLANGRSLAMNASRHQFVRHISKLLFAATRRRVIFETKL